MKHTQFHNKSLQQGTSFSQHRLVAGPNGIALTPPKYEIDFVDQQQSTDPGMTVQRQTGEVSSTSERQPENRTGLPDHLKAGIETLSGLSLDAVRVHYNSTKPATLQALAYTQGTDIHVATGQERHLPHEAWHVVQQAQGRVQSTMQTKGVGINDNTGLEHEADVMGMKALQVRHAEKSAFAIPIHTIQKMTNGASSSSHGVIQRLFVGDSSRHHMHVGPGIHQPHYVNGNGQASRINIGNNQNYRKANMETVIDALSSRVAESGAQACIDWCRAECRKITADAGGRAALRRLG